MVFNLDLRNSRFNGRFLGLSGSPKYIRFSSSICSGRVTLGINGTGFFTGRMPVLSANQRC